MAIKFYPFNSQNGDRKYSADDVARANEMLFSNGVMVAQGQVMSTELKVEHISGLRVKVNVGACMINGRTVEITNDGSDYILETVPTTTAARIDRVVARLHYSNRKIEIVVKEGTTVAPTLQRDTDIYELSLAQLHLGVNSTNITTVVDERDNLELCGVANVQIGVQPPLRPTGDSALNIKVTDDVALKYYHTNTPQNPLTVNNTLDMLSSTYDWRHRALLEQVNETCVANAYGENEKIQKTKGVGMALYKTLLKNSKIIPNLANEGGFSYTSENIYTPEHLFNYTKVNYPSYPIDGWGNFTLTMPRECTIYDVKLMYSKTGGTLKIYSSLDGVNYTYQANGIIQYTSDANWKGLGKLVKFNGAFKAKYVRFEISDASQNYLQGFQLFGDMHIPQFVTNISKQDNLDEIFGTNFDFVEYVYRINDVYKTFIKSNYYSDAFFNKYVEIFYPKLLAKTYGLDYENVNTLEDIVTSDVRLKQMIINQKNNNLSYYNSEYEQRLNQYYDLIKTTLDNSPLFTKTEVAHVGTTALTEVSDVNSIFMADTAWQNRSGYVYTSTLTYSKSGLAYDSDGKYTSTKPTENFKHFGIGVATIKNNNVSSNPTTYGIKYTVV